MLLWLNTLASFTAFCSLHEFCVPFSETTNERLFINEQTTRKTATNWNLQRWNDFHENKNVCFCNGYFLHRFQPNNGIKMRGYQIALHWDLLRYSKYESIKSSWWIQLKLVYIIQSPKFATLEMFQTTYKA